MFLSLPVTMLLTAIMIAVVAITFFNYASRLKKVYLKNMEQYDRSVEGVVSEQWKKETPLEKGEVSTVWYVNYKYVVDGQEYDVCSDIGHYKKMFQDDQPMTIRYNSENPERIYVVAENSHAKVAYTFLYVLGFLVVAAGVLMLVFATRL